MDYVSAIASCNIITINKYLHHHHHHEEKQSPSNKLQISLRVVNLSRDGAFPTTHDLIPGA